MIKNYYDILNIQINATEDEIKKAFRKLAAKYHPDRHNGDKELEEKFKSINEAYQTLSDPTARKEYDSILSGKQQFNGFNNKSNYENYKSYNSKTKSKTQNPFEDENFFAEFMKSFGQDVKPKSFYSKPKFNLSLTFLEAAFGCKKTVLVPEQILQGNIKANIQIPAATDNGTILNITVKGINFDIEISITEDLNNKYSRDGLDIITTIDIPLTTALLGGQMILNYIDKNIEVSIPANTIQNKKIRLKNLGIKKGSNVGHIILIANIVMPKNLTDKQKQLLKEFQKIENTK